MCDENKADDVTGQQWGRTVSAARQGSEGGGGGRAEGCVFLSPVCLFSLPLVVRAVQHRGPSVRPTGEKPASAGSPPGE